MVCSSVNDVSEYTRTVRSAHAVATMGSVGCGAVCQVRAVDTGCSVARGESVSVGAELSGCCGGGIFFSLVSFWRADGDEVGWERDFETVDR